MRILAIRGRNLASLAEPFEVDLAGSVLGGAGLFAITGDTGAGKSTILDALCLALYGTYPRCGARGEENRVRDPGGQELQAADPRHILRRGAGSGFAEVDFLGRDGSHYRARWEVHRARARPDGRLQSPAHSLLRLPDLAGVASGLQDVRAEVEQRTGFAFAQFRRAVLLAQGEFDAFLMADEKERAALLEQITGTDVYRRISQQVHEETACRERDIEAIEAARAGISLMDGGARAALEEERDRIAAAAGAAAAEHTALQERLRRAEAMADAREKLAEAETALARSTADAAAAAPRRRRLAALQTVAPLRHPVAQLAERAAEHATAAAARAEAALQLAAAGVASAAADGEVAAAAAVVAAASADVTRHQPLWAEATRLDQALAAAREEQSGAEAASARARAEADALAIRSAAARGDADELTGRLDACRQSLALRAGDAALAAAGDRPRRLVEEHRRLAAGREAAATAAGRASAEAAALAVRVAGVEQRLVEARAERARHDARLATLREARPDDAPLAAAGETLARAGDLLARARRGIQQRDTAEAERLRAGDIAAAAEAEEAAARRRLTEAETERDGARAVGRELRAVEDVASASLTRQAGELRAKLVAGEPCPVCGGRQHPFARSGDASAAIAAAIRARIAAIEERLGEAEERVAAATRAIEAARGRKEAAGRTATATAIDWAAAAAELATACDGLAAMAGALALQGVAIEAADLATREAIQLTGSRVSGRQELVAGEWQRIAALQREINAAQRLADAAREVCETEAEAAADHRFRQAGCEAEADRQAGIERELATRIGQLAAELAPFVAACGLGAGDLDRDAGAVADRLTRAADAYRQLEADRIRLSAQCEASEREAAALAAGREHAAGHAAAAAATLAERRARTECLAADRIRLFAGEPTDGHRTRLIAASEAAAAVHELAQERAAVAGLELARARATDLATEQAEVATRQRRDAARGELEAGIAATGMAEADVRELLDVPAEAVAELQNAMSGLDAGHMATMLAAAQRRGDLDALLATSPDAVEADRQALAATIDERSADLARVHARLGEIAATLAADDRARERVAEVALRIEEKSRDLAIWRDVDAAIGQQTGDRFRRFAQGLTLAHLVRLANERLAMLGPRYALGRSPLSDLGLEVIDRDMGDEARTPRSLSGGERFLVSLALALALSGLEGRQSFVDTLFIDEGFGSLDRDTLEVAITALETLVGQGRKVGVVTHVAAMIERIPVQVRVVKRSAGRSAVSVGESEAAA